MQDKPINPIDAQVGLNLKRMRAVRGISREKLGASLSEPISQQAIEKYETGANRIAASTLVEITVALQCRMSDLFHGVERIMKENEQPEVDIYDKGAQNMLKHYHALNNKGMQEAVANLTRALVLELSRGYSVNK